MVSASQNTLTHFESQALHGGLNVSDGHPRMRLTASQEQIVDCLPKLFREAKHRQFDDVEQEAQRAFLSGIGQIRAPIGSDRLLSCYSSSTATDIVARALSGRTSSVALIHPTFDNIPDLLRARGLTLHPVGELEFEDDACQQLPAHVGAVFVTTPNNPTGWVLTAGSLAKIADVCAQSGRVLVLDTCFRAHDLRAQYDTYEILDHSGAEWVVIEDTGKVWPVLELKAGFLAWGERTNLELLTGFNDVLLTMSPVILLLIRELAQDGVRGGYARLHQLLAENRALLEGALSGSPLALADPDSRISVARVTWDVTTKDATDVYRELLAAYRVHTLPCGPFHWARPQEGQRKLRLALGRDGAEVSAAAKVLAEMANRW